MPARQLLAKVHIAKKELGLDDEVYWMTLENLTGKRSAAEMTNLQLVKVIKHFEIKGWVPSCAKASAGKPKKYYNLGQRDPYKATPAQFRKIEAMWHDVCYNGADERASLRKFIFKMTRVSDIVFLDGDQAYKVIEAIKAIKSRKQE